MREATINPELLEMMAGRHSCYERAWVFPFEDGAIQMNRFAIEGKVMWEVWLHKHFWNEVALGNIGLNPQKLFKKEYVN